MSRDNNQTDVVRSLEAKDRAGIRRAVMRLAWPVVLQQFFRTLMFYVDTIMIGHYDPSGSALAAMGIVGPWTYTVISVIMALGIGTVATVARAVGENDPEKARANAATSIAIALGSGLALSALGYFFLPYGAGLYSVPGFPEIDQQAADYLIFLGAGLLFFLLENASSSILRAAGDTKTPMILSIACNVFNVAANYVLIFGRWGFPELGVMGAGIATASSMALQAILTTGWIFTPWSVLRLGISSFSKVSRESTRRLVKVTIPAVVEPLILQSGFMVYAKAVTMLGAAPLAAHRAAIAIESLSFMPGHGLSIACSALVGQSIGAEKSDVAKAGLQESTRIAAWIMSGLGLVFLLLNVPLMGIFVPGNDSVIYLGAVCLAICAFEQPFMAMSMTYGGALRGAGDTWSPAWVGIVGVWLVRVPFAYALAFGLGLGLYGIWITMILDWLARAIVFRWIWGRGKWREIKL